jgi:hypothetical protein
MLASVGVDGGVFAFLARTAWRLIAFRRGVDCGFVVVMAASNQLSIEFQVEKSIGRPKVRPPGS